MAKQGLSILLFMQISKKIFLILILIFVLSETLIFLSGDRSAFLHKFFSILKFYFQKKLLNIIKLNHFVIYLILIVLITFINPSAKERVLDKTLSQMNILNDKNKKDEINIINENSKKDEKYLYIYQKNILKCIYQHIKCFWTIKYLA